MAVLLPRRFAPSTAGTGLTTSAGGAWVRVGGQAPHVSPALPGMTALVPPCPGTESLECRFMLTLALISASWLNGKWSWSRR